MKYQIDKGFLAYDQVGKGTPLLFIHGYPLSRRIWLSQLDGLANTATLISLDLRGHGESYPFEGSYPMNLLADDCKQLLDHLKVNPPITVCGLSMGGYVTFALYRKYPQLFKGIILTSTRAAADSPEGMANRDRAIQDVTNHGVSFIADGMLPKSVSPITSASRPELMKTIHDIMLGTSVKGIIGASQGMRDRPDSTALLPQIKCPVLIIHGVDDQIIPIKEAEAMQHLIPNSRLVLIPEAGHLLNMEQPDRFNQAVREFIKSLDN